MIVPSKSKFASPVLPVRRKKGKLRLYVAYRKINNKTIPDRYLLPIIDDQLDQLRDAKVFSTIDLENIFHHIDVNPERIHRAFVTQSGHYKYVKTPFGVRNGPAVFQRYVYYISKDLIRNKTS